MSTFTERLAAAQDGDCVEATHEELSALQGRDGAQLAREIYDSLQDHRAVCGGTLFLDPFQFEVMVRFERLASKLDRVIELLETTSGQG